MEMQYITTWMYMETRKKVQAHILPEQKLRSQADCNEEQHGPNYNLVPGKFRLKDAQRRRWTPWMMHEPICRGLDSADFPRSRSATCPSFSTRVEVQRRL